MPTVVVRVSIRIRPGVAALGTVGLGLTAWGIHVEPSWTAATSAVATDRRQLLGPALVIVLGVVFVLERLRPAEARPASARGHVHDGLYLLLYATVVVPVVVLGGIGFGALVRRLTPWVVLPALPAIPHGLFVVAALVATDGANWLAHWANHRVTTLWRLHAVHHTQTQMSILTGFRAHPAVHVSFLVASLPAIVLARNGVVPAQVLVVYIVAATLPHANLRWGSGPVGRAVGRVLVTPAFHRFHHDLDGPAGQNLGTVLVVWDRLAGTARRPRPGDVAVRTGVAPQPTTAESGDPHLVEQEAGHLRTLAVQLTEPFVASARVDRTSRPAPA